MFDIFLIFIWYLFLSTIIDTSKSEHLNTKKQIENVREMYGENNWLHSHAGSYVQGILGIKQQSEREPLILPNAVWINFFYIYILLMQ